MNFLRILIERHNYVECIKVLSKEIEFLRTSEKCRFEGIQVYILDLMLVYMITHNTKEIELANELIE